MNGLKEEGEAGGAQMAIALCVHFSHQHVVTAWTRDNEEIQSKLLSFTSEQLVIFKGKHLKEQHWKWTIPVK